MLIPRDLHQRDLTALVNHGPGLPGILDHDTIDRATATGGATADPPPDLMKQR
jgi:hypothetical protein